MTGYRAHTKNKNVCVLKVRRYERKHNIISTWANTMLLLVCLENTIAVQSMNWYCIGISTMKMKILVIFHLINCETQVLLGNIVNYWLDSTSTHGYRNELIKSHVEKELFLEMKHYNLWLQIKFT